MMTFKEAFNEMVLNGALIKRTSWAGYWKWENGTIMMHCKEGNVMDIRHTRDVSYTIRGMLKDDWEIATTENSPLLEKEVQDELNSSSYVSALATSISKINEDSAEINFIAGLGGSI